MRRHTLNHKYLFYVSPSKFPCSMLVSWMRPGSARTQMLGTSMNKLLLKRTVQISFRMELQVHHGASADQYAYRILQVFHSWPSNATAAKNLPHPFLSPNACCIARVPDSRILGEFPAVQKFTTLWIQLRFSLSQLKKGVSCLPSWDIR